MPLKNQFELTLMQSLAPPFQIQSPTHINLITQKSLYTKPIQAHSLSPKSCYRGGDQVLQFLMEQSFVKRGEANFTTLL
jgi:hypothetical protein